MPTGTAGRRSCSGGDIYISRLSLAGTVAWSITRHTCYAPSLRRGVDDGGGPPSLGRGVDDGGGPRPWDGVEDDGGGPRP